MDEDIDQLNVSYDTGLPRTSNDVVPHVTSLEDFELCCAVKDKNKMTGEFRVLEANDVELKSSGITGWEVLFVQFRDKKTGEFFWNLYSFTIVSNVLSNVYLGSN